ncbi:hypothetical protein KSP39_PZI019331 [Platanthera zijinensis]|uniref:Fe2OG dioxygenase domain-containing protein n=1 Tax=Platanthera zijinensis TaxID=2320716 RepID=A0AAP0B2J1_9ASPA
MAWNKLILGLLTLVSVGMIIGSLFQLEFIHRLEEPLGVSHWENDKEAAALRIGYVTASQGKGKGDKQNKEKGKDKVVVKPEVISWLPRMILFHSFLSDEECEFLKALSRPRLEISTVVDAKTGKGVKSQVRTSSGMFLSSEERKHPIVQAIENRIATFSQIPVENGELIQVLRYEVNQQYRPHHDYFSDSYNLKRGGQRVATILMYLSDNVEGGETHFPLAGDGVCSCGGKKVSGVCIKPNKGDAVLFWSMDLNGESDRNSLHAGCPVLKGEKWSATKWMRQKATY